MIIDSAGTFVTSGPHVEAFDYLCLLALNLASVWWAAIWPHWMLIAIIQHWPVDSEWQAQLTWVTSWVTTI